ncbi:MAG TPA: hypothetical protein VNR42_08465 [Solirubrobacteraceae bacterium]|nr:hypothetical protein [Solirubrobacteraceae bacterium]
MHKANLEDYLRTARVLHTAPLGGGLGHRHKQLLILDGGLGVVAKLAEGPDDGARSIAARQVCSEVAAWFLAHELGWDDLVPVTTMGVVKSKFTGEHVAASLQIAWPRFNLAAELAMEPADCDDSDRWRVAIFDALAGNTDRNATNWGLIQDLPRAKLIDHGSGFGLEPTTSQFATELNGEQIPEMHKRYLETFIANEKGSRLPTILPDTAALTLFERAQDLVQNGTLSIQNLQNPILSPNCDI